MARHAEAAHQRLRAVVAGAHADVLAVEELGDVVRVHAVDLEGDHAAARVGVGRAETRDAGDLGEPLERVGGQLALVCADALHAERGEVVDGGAEPDGLGDRRRAGLELPRQLVPGRALAARRVGSCRRRPGTGASRSSSSRAPVQHADARRAERLVAGPGVEVGVDLAARRPAAAARPARRRSAITAPAARARAAISATGLIVPSTFETCATATSFTRPRGEHRVELVERELVPSSETSR